MTERPLIIAHRGSSAWAPENSLAAFRLAMEQGADGIEFDVRLSKDGQAVVIHDSTLERTARKPIRVDALTAKELGKIDIGSWFNAAHPKRAKGHFANERVATLAETLVALKDFRGLIYVELKCKESEVDELSKAVCEVITGSHLLPQMIVKSFKLGVIPRMRFGCPKVKTAALFAPKIMRFLRKGKHVVRIAEEFGAQHLSVHYSLASRKLMKKVDRSGIKVAIWTVNKENWLRRAEQRGIFAVITNDPPRLIDARQRTKKRIVLREIE
jgi:glycerophosphoryl diester phosphodiesterase